MRKTYSAPASYGKPT